MTASPRTGGMVGGPARKVPRDGSAMGGLLAAYLRTHRMTQGDLAEKLGVDRTLINKYLRGDRVLRDVGELRRIAGVLGLPAEDLGLLPDPEWDRATRPAYSDDDARSEAEAWRLVRRSLNRHRHELTRIAASLYPDAERVEGTRLITRSDWMAPAPVDFASVELSWHADAPRPLITGEEPASEAYRPTAPTGTRYARYTQAVRQIDRPALFDNRVSYRLLDLSWAAGGGAQAYGYTTYFDMVDVCEVLAHELAAAWTRTRDAGREPTWDDLPFRALIGDLFVLARRPVLPSINTLTIRRQADGAASFFLHRRGASKVTVAGGLTHIMPAGVFQPSGIAPWNVAADFDMWHNVLREYSEEFLGNPEHDGSSGEMVDYDGSFPFREMNAARLAGRVRPYVFGVGLDPLAPAGEILSVVVIDADVFDEVFAQMVTSNPEGDVVASVPGTVGIPWTGETVRRVLAEEPLAPAAAACLALTWKHRAELLAG